MEISQLETLVVIATHGDTSASLALTLNAIPATQPVAVVQTGKHSPEVSVLCATYPNVVYLRTPYRGYDTGAYLWAYFQIPSKAYLFMQDSCTPREKDFIEQFAAKMPGRFGAVGWSSFTMKCWDSDDQCKATSWMYGDSQKWPRYGIFGPIFYTTRESLDLLWEEGLLPMPPMHKQQQQAMERAWAICFHRAGMTVNFLVEEEMPRGHVMGSGGYPALNKVFRMRA
jgi:hypothetical protein